MLLFILTRPGEARVVALDPSPPLLALNMVMRTRPFCRGSFEFQWRQESQESTRAKSIRGALTHCHCIPLSFDH